MQQKIYRLEILKARDSSPVAIYATTPQECLTRLKRHLPNYKKDIDGKKITLELITKAIARGVVALLTGVVKR